MSRSRRHPAGRFAGPQRPKARLWLRPLEDRIAPATFTVTNLGDTGAGSGNSGDLRYCINQANATPGTNAIDATGVAGTIALGSSFPAVTQSLGISGPGASLLTIHAYIRNGGVFTIGAGASFLLDGVTVTGGLNNNPGGAIAAGTGGNVTVANCVITANAASAGGGVYVSGGALTVRNTTITANTAGNGGGVYFAGTAAALVVSNCTIASNSAGSGGGVYVNLSSGSGTASIVSCTIADNSIRTAGGGIYVNRTAGTGTALLDNTIVSGDGFPYTATNLDVGSNIAVGIQYCAISTVPSNFTDLGHNHLSNSLGYIVLYVDSMANVPVPGANPPRTMPVYPVRWDNPVVGAGDPALAGTTDELGTARPVGSGVDIGAVERLTGTPVLGGFSAHDVKTQFEPAVYQFTVTYSVETAMQLASIVGNNNAVTVTPPAGIPPVPVTFVRADQASDAPNVTATYQFSVPGGAWTLADNGSWTVTLAANQVQSINNVFVLGQPVGKFNVLVPRIFTVTNLNDSGTGSLRQAVATGNGNITVPDYIQFAPGLIGTITLTSGPLTVANSMSIIGPTGRLITVNGNNAGQVFALTGSGLTVVLKNLEITGGSTTDVGGGVSYGTNSYDTITLDTDWVHDNRARDGGGVGGTGGATINVVNSAITGNTALSLGGSYASGLGGGIYGYAPPNSGAPVVSVRNSTIAGNVGGGINLASHPFDIFEGLYPYGGGSITLHNATLSGNDVGIAQTPNGLGTVYANLVSSIVSGNTGGDFSGDPRVEASFSAVGSRAAVSHFYDDGHNLIGVTLSIQPLAINGGLTPTCALPAGSPAIHAGSNPDNLAYDQRGDGFPRTTPPGLPDIGAYQFQPRYPLAVSFATNVTDPNPPVTYQFNVKYYSDVSAIRFSSVNGNSNAVTITPPAGVAPVAVSFVSATPANSAGVITATYQFTFPGAFNVGADDGTWTVNMAANQIQDINGNFIPAGPLGTFTVQVPKLITVTNTNSSGPGSLADAINQANAAPFPYRIVFSKSTVGGTVNFYDGVTHAITLTAALPTVTQGIVIDGPGSGLLVVNANHTGSVLKSTAPTGSTMTLTGLSLNGGSAGPYSGGGIDAYYSDLVLTDVSIRGNTAGGGGGIACEGNLTLTNSTVGQNSVTNLSGAGAGIYVGYNSNPNQTVTIVNCSIRGNSMTSGNGGGIFGDVPNLSITDTTIGNNYAGSGGGGIDCRGAHNFVMTGSTISGNSTNGGGGGVNLDYDYSAANIMINDCTIVGNSAGAGTGSGAGTGGGINVVSTWNPSIVNVVNSTITGNTAAATGTSNPGYGGGGIAESSGNDPIVLDNSIVSGNLAANGRTDVAVTSGVNVTTSYSAIGNTNGFTYTPGPGDLPVGADLKLQPLANNGGPTLTIAFAAGSPLLNAGDPNLANTADQRGVPRTIGPAPDIGAYEYRPISAAGVQINDGSAQRSEVRSITVTFSGQVAFAGGNAAAVFRLNHTQTGNGVVLAAAVSTNPAGQTVVTLTFSGSETDPVSALNGGVPSLADGRYQLTIAGNSVADAALGWGLDGNADGTPGGDYVSPTDAYHGTGLHLYRLFGDVTGDGVVDVGDLGLLRSALNTGVASPLYLSYLDADNSGAVDFSDLGQFRSRFNRNVFV